MPTCGDRVDPHKRSSTIEILGKGEHVLATGRFGTDRDGDRHLGS